MLMWLADGRQVNLMMSLPCMALLTPSPPVSPCLHSAFANDCCRRYGWYKAPHTYTYYVFMWVGIAIPCKRYGRSFAINPLTVYFFFSLKILSFRFVFTVFFRPIHFVVGIGKGSLMEIFSSNSCTLCTVCVWQNIPANMTQYELNIFLSVSHSPSTRAPWMDSVSNRSDHSVQHFFALVSDVRFFFCGILTQWMTPIIIPASIAKRGEKWFSSIITKRNRYDAIEMRS